jgi:hypothetical protein
MIFAQNGSILFNDIHSLADGAGASAITQAASTGDRTVVLVANETPSVAGALGSVSNVSDLNGIKFDETDFGETTHIPMYARYDNVSISQAGGATKVEAGAGSYTYPTPWPVVLVRVGTKVSLVATASGDMTPYFTGVTFSNLPDKVPLAPTVANNDGSHMRSYAASTFTQSYSSATNTWTATNDCIILPSKYFAGGTVADAVVATVNMSGSVADLSGPVCIDRAGGNYAMPRNTVYNVTATLNLPVEVNVSYADWGAPIGTDIDLQGRILNVSDISGLMISWVPDEKRRIYFYTNSGLPSGSVKVETDVVRLSDNTVQSFTSVFDATDGYFNYNSSTGQGWIDLVMRQSGGIGTANNDYRFTLNSNGLKRTIEVHTEDFYFTDSGVYVACADTYVDGSPAQAGAVNTPQLCTWPQAAGYDPAGYMFAGNPATTYMNFTNSQHGNLDPFVMLPPNAATGCAAYNDPQMGAGGWRLPRYVEIIQGLWRNRTRISRTTDMVRTNHYWALVESSSIASGAVAMLINSESGTTYGSQSKSSTGYNTRCVRDRVVGSATVTYDANGAAATGMPSSQNAPKGSQTTVSSAVPLFTGNSNILFAYWAAKSDGKGFAVAPGQTFTMPDGDVTLYAQWFDVTATPTPSTYTGAFWRYDQTGERLINLTSNTPWMATALVGRDWIKLDNKPSADPNVYTTTAADMNNAANDAAYQVSDNRITGFTSTSELFFRAGLHSALASAATQPRYGAILLRYNNYNNSTLIFVRQGEAPDALNGTAKWSPFNLSDPLRGTGGSLSANHNLAPSQAAAVSTTFADYPSQAGYLFQWNNYGATATTGRAWHLSNASTITDWPSGTASSWVEANDPCPAGYRSPTAAEYATYASAPSMVGTYADGFHDRHTKTANSVTGQLNWQRSLYGRLFYNPTTCAAIFMPICGNRMTGSYSWTTYGCYASSGASANQISLLFTSGTVEANSTTFSKNRGLSIRCVKK